jgi:hypothetical protein
MAEYWVSEYSFITGSLRTSNLSLVVMVKDELTENNISHFFSIGWNNGNWQSWDPEGMREWEVVGLCNCQIPMEQWLIIGFWGEILCVGSGDIHEENVIAGEDSPDKHGPMRGINNINGKAYAVGMNRQVYRRDAKDIWRCMHYSSETDNEEDDSEVIGFEAIDGFSDDEIYTVGLGGEIWKYNGSVWQAVDSPTNLPLTCVICAGDGNVYACGRKGILLSGRDSSWNLIEHDVMEDDIWGMAWFKDELYLSTLWEVYKLNKQFSLTPVNFGSDVPSSCFHLSESNGVLWSVGKKDIMSFDGNKWYRID